MKATVTMLFLLSLSLLPTLARAQGGDVLGRSAGRVLRDQDARYEEEKVRQEKASLDHLSREQRERVALAFVELRGDRVLTKVRSGGEVRPKIKKADFDLGEMTHAGGWDVRQGSFTVPAKIKALKLVLATPDGRELSVSCTEGAGRIGQEDLVFAVVTMNNGDLYCPEPLAAEEAGT